MKTAASRRARVRRLAQRLRLPLLILAALGAIHVLAVVVRARLAAQLEHSLLEGESARVPAQAAQLGNDLRGLAARLRLLAESESLAGSGAGGLERFAREAAAMSRHDGMIERISFFDITAVERARVDRAAGIALAGPAGGGLAAAGGPAAGFLRRVAAAPAGVVTVGDFEPGRASGRGERGWPAFVHLGAAVRSREGAPQGALVITVLGESLIERMRHTTPAHRRRARLLDAGGRWLLGPAREGEPAGAECAALGVTAPELWAEILRRTEGQSVRDGAVFTWRRFQPASEVNGFAGRADDGNSFLVVAAEIEAEEWRASFNRLRQSIVVIWLGGLLVAGVALWLHERQRSEWIRRCAGDELNAAIVRSAGAGVVTLALDGTVRTFNAAAERMLGWRAADVVERQHASIFYDRKELRSFAQEAGAALGVRFRHGLDALAATVAQTHDPVERAWTFVRRDGTCFRAWVAHSAIRGADGEVAGFLGVFTDLRLRREEETFPANPRE